MQKAQDRFSAVTNDCTPDLESGRIVSKMAADLLTLEGEHLLQSLHV